MSYLLGILGSEDDELHEMKEDSDYELYILKVIID